MDIYFIVFLILIINFSIIAYILHKHVAKIAAVVAYAAENAAFVAFHGNNLIDAVGIIIG